MFIFIGLSINWALFIEIHEKDKTGFFYGIIIYQARRFTMININNIIFLKRISVIFYLLACYSISCNDAETDDNDKNKSTDTDIETTTDLSTMRGTDTSTDSDMNLSENPESDNTAIEHVDEENGKDGEKETNADGLTSSGKNEKPAFEIDTDIDFDAIDTIDIDTSNEIGSSSDLFWVTIPGGSFQIGASNETSAHKVSISSFQMTKTEVTVNQYEECVSSGECSEPDSKGPYDNWGEPQRKNHPVNSVDWNQSREFCLWAGGRLPSESEWEYAATCAGLEINYPWGNETATCDYAVMSEDGDGCGTERTMEVCSKPKGNTQQGLCDMAGNVYEWVEDDYHDDFNETPADGTAWIENPRSALRVRRGGSFYWDNAEALNVNYRLATGPSSKYPEIGFRCARQNTAP
jgi:formylglycine-generating enzyme required for sulfatase activity